MKKPVISMGLNKGFVTINGSPNKITLPDGCIGYMLVFESKTAARKWDKTSALTEIEIVERD